MTKFVLAAAALCLSAGAASAQMGPFKIGVAGGLSAPVGKVSDNFKTGFALTGNIGIKPPLIPLTFQAEVGWNQWGAKDFPSTADGHARVVNVCKLSLHSCSRPRWQSLAW